MAAWARSWRRRGTYSLKKKAGAPVCSGRLLCSLSNEPRIGPPRPCLWARTTGNRKKAPGSYRTVFSHCSPSSGLAVPSFRPDLWRSVNSYRAVSLSPSSSLSPMSYFSAAAERGHASSGGRCLWRQERRDVWHTPSDASILMFLISAARGRCIFSETLFYKGPTGLCPRYEWNRNDTEFEVKTKL